MHNFRHSVEYFSGTEATLADRLDFYDQQGHEVVTVQHLSVAECLVRRFNYMIVMRRRV